MTEPELGVVIPTLNEAEALPALLGDLALIPRSVRVVVADGGSADGTVEIARAAGARVVSAPRGRGPQMNAGAAALTSPWLLFLHADSRLPHATRDALDRWLHAPSPEEAAHFAFRLEGRSPWWRIIEGGQRLRERWTGLAYGDQGLVMSRRRWRELGGFADIPVMEDVEAVRRLRRSGGLARIDEAVVTSPRRYREEGTLRAWLRNALAMALYGAGVAPKRLARWHRPRTAGGEAGRPPILLVFAKAPRPGCVKTRLARDLGDAEAAAVYRTIGRKVVDRLRGGGYRIVVCHTPADAGEEVGRWLGPHGLELRPQHEGDLGERMQRAFDEAFREADRVCIVGTDSPDLDRARVEEALACLDEGEGADAVFGPATDGGYYLLALRRPAPDLFRDIPWSTDRVLELSLTRARDLGLRVRTVDPLDDVDRLEDLPLELNPRAR